MIKITTAHRLYEPNNVREVELQDVFNAIKTGCYNGQDLIAPTIAIRQASTYEQKNELKKQHLPCALFNGVFTSKKSIYLKEYSRVTAIDFDNFESYEAMAHIWGRLTATPCVIAVYVTPGGRGLKAIVLHDNTDICAHNDLYKQLLEKFRVPEIDNSCTDLARGNYLCYDPNIWVRQESAVPYHYEPSKPKEAYQWTPKAKPMTAKVSDRSIIAMLNSNWKKKNPEYWKEGHRAISIFHCATLMCKLGVNEKLAKQYFLDSWMPTGLDAREILHNFFGAYKYVRSTRQEASIEWYSVKGTTKDNL